MTNQHRATPEHWEYMERYAEPSYPYSCILELRARIEALEAAQQPQDKLDRLIALDADNPAEDAAQQPYLFRAEEVARTVAPTVKDSLTDPAGSLLDRVTWLIAKRFSESSPGTDCTPFGRAAILEVAAWFRTERDSPETAAALEQEAER